MERERRGWASAVPLDADRRKCILLPLALSFGAIDEMGIGPMREAALRQLLADVPHLEEEMLPRLLRDARAALEKLLVGAREGEAMRVWLGRTPDDACALCWLLDQLRPIGWDHLTLSVVPLPDYVERPDGSVVRYSGWGEIEPWDWGRYAASARVLPRHLLPALAAHWQRLRQENQPLRAMINGKLTSVPEDFYDPFIRRELAGQPSEFSETRFIGQLLVRYGFGLSGDLIAWRIERMIAAGELEPVTQPAPGDPAYHRTLRKRGSEAAL